MEKKQSKEILENELNYNDFNLEFDKKEKNLICLTTPNIQKIETMLRYNPDYPEFFDYNLLKDNNYIKDAIEKTKIEKQNNEKSKKDEFKYPSFYYIKALEEYHNEKGIYPYYIKAILRKINSENSTRASKKDINKIASAIADDIKYNNLIDYIKKPDKYDYNVIEYICMKGSKRYLSLATKFCHYMSFILFFGTNYADTYSIYDSVVNDNLNSYASHLKIESNYNSQELKNLQKKEWKEIKNSYIKYQETINKIITKANISRNGFDHLVWYSNKNN